MKQILLITPPFTQLNTPYPATAYIKGFLNTKNISAFQMDLGIEVILELFSKKGLADVRSLRLHRPEVAVCEDTNHGVDVVGGVRGLCHVRGLCLHRPEAEVCEDTNHGIIIEKYSENAQRIFALWDDYLQTIDPVIAFLQGKNPTLARQICQDGFLPEASRFQQLDDMEWAFGSMGIQDKAKHLATLYLEDISDFIKECIDENFGFSRYAERLGRSANSFDELYEYLQKEPTYIDTISLKILSEKLTAVQPFMVCISVPFPGNLYAAFRVAQFVKKYYPETKICMGGGFVNTELREIKDVRVFEFFDYITLDDGELPLELIIKAIAQAPPTAPPAPEGGANLPFDSLLLSGGLSEEQAPLLGAGGAMAAAAGTFKRTFLLSDGQVVYKNDFTKSDYKQSEVGTPDYSDLYLDKYISVIEIANPMHSLWSDGRWNKLTLAHGCYWGKCTFCDISLDYIKLYEPVAARTIVDRMEQLIAQTGENGFHFVDEAAPPALMREVALEILRRKLAVTWWTNIRFEKSFTHDLCVLLRASGCIAVSGGLEVASDRLLALIEKGVTVAQVAQVCRNFTESGIMVHAYLMYGYPTQTIQETIDSLEMVRQMFELGILQSGFWHQFAMTAHSPVGMNPAAFGVIPEKNIITFANNDIQFKDKTGIDHDKFSFGLKKSLFNFMHGICFEMPLQDWFEFKIPRTSIKPDFIQNTLQEEENFTIKPSAKIVWLGKNPVVEHFTKSKRAEVREMLKLTFHDKRESFVIQTEKNQGEWLVDLLGKLSLKQAKTYNFQEIKKDFESRHLNDFELFWFSKPVNTLRQSGLLVL